MACHSKDVAYLPHKISLASVHHFNAYGARNLKLDWFCNIWGQSKPVMYSFVPNFTLIGSSSCRWGEGMWLYYLIQHSLMLPHGNAETTLNMIAQLQTFPHPTMSKVSLIQTLHGNILLGTVTIHTVMFNKKWNYFAFPVSFAVWYTLYNMFQHSLVAFVVSYMFAMLIYRPTLLYIMTEVRGANHELSCNYAIHTW